jgi:hypothetical protein
MVSPHCPPSFLEVSNPTQITVCLAVTTATVRAAAVAMALSMTALMMKRTALMLGPKKT